MRKKYIWGCGNYSDLLLKNLSQMGTYQFDGYIDSSKNGFHNGKAIYWIDDVEQGAYIIVAVKDYKEIEEILCSKGFKPVQDYICINQMVKLSEARNYADVYQNMIIGEFSNLSVSMSACSIINIGKNVKFGKNVSIVCSGFSKVIIDDDVIIGDNVLILCEGESQLNLEKRCVVKSNSYIESKNKSVIDLRRRCILGESAEITVGNHSLLQIGEGTGFDKRMIMRVLRKSRVIIGDDSMFSYNVSIRGEQGHDIFHNGKQKSHNCNVIIGDHVWVGMNASILPGTIIGSGSIVGAASITNKEYGKNKLIVGVPGTVIKENVSWER